MNTVSLIEAAELNTGQGGNQVNIVYLVLAISLTIVLGVSTTVCSVSGLSRFVDTKPPTGPLAVFVEFVQEPFEGAVRRKFFGSQKKLV